MHTLQRMILEKPTKCGSVKVNSHSAHGRAKAPTSPSLSNDFKAFSHMCVSCIILSGIGSRNARALIIRMPIVGNIISTMSSVQGRSLSLSPCGTT
eukprot:9476905-Pyramimonas_sp.AAC.1